MQSTMMDVPLSLNHFLDRAGTLFRHQQIVSRLNAAGSPVQVLFTPHLAPMNRGILATCYARPTEPTSTDELREVLTKAYDAEPFVVVRDEPPSTKRSSCGPDRSAEHKSTDVGLIRSRHVDELAIMDVPSKRPRCEDHDLMPTYRRCDCMTEFVYDHRNERDRNCG